MLSGQPGRLLGGVLACLLFSSVLAQDESRNGRFGSASTADEAALRALAQEFYAVMQRRIWTASYGCGARSPRARFAPRDHAETLRRT